MSFQISLPFLYRWNISNKVSFSSFFQKQRSGLSLNNYMFCVILVKLLASTAFLVWTVSLVFLL